MLTATLNNKHQYYEQHNLIRKRKPVSVRIANDILIEEKACVNFSSNDYLGLTCSEELKKAYIEGINKYGVGSGASAMISGYYKIQQKTEEAFAEFLQRDKAILFNSGYAANIGAITSLADRHSKIISDKFCHASILDAVQLSRAKHYRYQHNNLEQIQKLITDKSPDFLVTESVFGMQGDVTPLEKINEIISGTKTKIILDDAHGVGVMNKKYQNVECLITPLGKAFGCLGGVVSGKEMLIEKILQFSRTYLYTTALPPAMYAAIFKSLEIVQKEKWRQETLSHLCEFFIEHAKRRDISLVSEEVTPIKCIIIPEVNRALQIQKTLMNLGFFVACIRPPTVPVGASRLRISLNCLHTERQIIQLLDCIKELL